MHKLHFSGTQFFSFRTELQFDVFVLNNCLTIMLFSKHHKSVSKPPSHLRFSFTLGRNCPKIMIKMSQIWSFQPNFKCSKYFVVKLWKWIEDKCPFFDNKIDSKYQIMTSQLITSFHNVDLKFLNSKFFVLL